MDLMIKTLQRCRAVYAPALALLPPGATTMVEGLELKQDALIGKLNSGEITFGDYNTAMDRLRQALSLVLPQSTQVPSALAEAVQQSAKGSEPVTPSPAIANVGAQQTDATKSNQTYEAAAAKAQADCAALWANHAFDPYRDRIPFGEDKPTRSTISAAICSSLSDATQSTQL
jgi:hypothetical protein